MDECVETIRPSLLFFFSHNQRPVAMQKFFLLIFFSAVLSACSQHYFYAPNTLHLPEVREKGEATVEAALTGSSQIKGGEVKAAYAINPSYSVMVNHAFMRGSFTRSTSFVFPPPPDEYHSGRGFISEAGISRHFPISQYAQFTMTAGVGIGRSVNDYDRGRTARLNFNRIFLQPGISSRGELVDFGIGLRFSRLHFYDGRADYAISENDIQDVLEIDQHGAFYIPDVGLSAGISFSPVHLKYNMVVSTWDKISEYSFSGNNISLSMLVDINAFTPKNKTKSGKSAKKKTSTHKKKKKKKH